MVDQDRTDADLEALLRATFWSEARNQVSDSRPVPPFPDTTRLATVYPMRRRWVGISLVAAALVAIAVGATVISSEAMHAERPPAPAGTGSTPVPTGTTAAPVTSPTSAGSPTSPSTASSTGSAPPAAATKEVTVQGVVLTVPTTWNVIARPVGDAGDTPSVCLTTDTGIRSVGAGESNCQLSLSVGAALWGSHDVDRVGFAPDGGLCGTDNRRPHETDTVVADELVVDGQTAEHREFTGFCLDHSLDQWTVPTAPFVQFWRDFGPADAKGRAQALEVVRTAQLPGPRSALRLADHGYITAVTGGTVSLDRITDLNQLGIQNSNPATYDYPIGTSATITFGSVALSVDQLRALAAGQTVAGVPALDTLEADLDTDGSAVTRLELSPRT